MKEHKIKFVKRAALFLLILLCIVIILQVIYYETVAQSKFATRKNIIFQQNLKENPHVKYAFFGDSHLLNAVNPDYINNSLNFATSGESYLEIYYHIKKLTDEGAKIDNVILEVDLHTFSKRPTKFKTTSPNYYCTFVPYKDMNFGYHVSYSDYFICKYNLFFGSGGDILTRLTMPIKDYVSNKGWQPFDGDISKLNKEDFNKVIEDKVLNHFEDKLEIDPNQFEYYYFNKTLSLLKEKNISIIFIMNPVSKEYEEMIEKRGISKDKTYMRIFSLINNTTTDYRILDYSRLLNESKYFSDASHVNPRGAEIVSKKISGDFGLIFKK